MASDRVSEWKPHLGRKVSIRYRLDAGAHPFSEAIGVVAEVTEDVGGAQTITILTRRGDRKLVRSDDIVAAKLFPV